MSFKKQLVSFVALVMFLLNSYLPVTATIFEPEPIDKSEFVPTVRLASDSVIEVGPGKSTAVTVQVRNAGTSRAVNFFAQIIQTENDPFVANFTNMSGSDNISAGVTKNLELTINVEAGAEPKSYPVKLAFTYSNEYKVMYERQETLIIKVVDRYHTPNIDIYDISLSPQSLAAGETGDLTFKYMNRSSFTEDYVRISLDGLSTEAITVPNGLSTQILTNVLTYHVADMSFKIKAASGLKSGSYPIKIVSEVKLQDGTFVKEEYQYFVSVGGAGTDVGKANLEIINNVVPSSVYGVGEGFNIQFDIMNSSNYDAQNVVVRAVPVDGGALIPTTQSVLNFRTIKGGERVPCTFTFVATSGAKTQNYPISFTIDYDNLTEDEQGKPEKSNFSHYFGVSISNPEEEEEEDNELERRNVPKIVISSYTCDPVNVQAGREFDLNMTFMNTHATKTVKNIKASLTALDKDGATTASIFSPVQASNSLYVDEISPKGTVERSIRYFTISSAQPQTYSITVTFEYEDEEGVAQEESEIVGINVIQPPRIETTEIIVPTEVYMGEPTYISFEVINSGEVAVNNLKVIIDADVETTQRTTFIGRLESQSTQYYEGSFFPKGEEPIAGKIIVSYDSMTGEHFEIPTEFTANVMAPMPMDMPMMDMPMEEPQGGLNLSTGQKVGVGIGLVVLTAAAIGGYKAYQKKKKGNDYEQY